MIEGGKQPKLIPLYNRVLRQLVLLNLGLGPRRIESTSENGVVAATQSQAAEEFCARLNVFTLRVKGDSCESLERFSSDDAKHWQS